MRARVLVAIAALSFGCNRRERFAEQEPADGSQSSALSLTFAQLQKPVRAGFADLMDEPVTSGVCDPRVFPRPNERKTFREPEGLGGCPPGMTRVPGRSACIDRWEAHVVEERDDGSERTWSPYFNPGASRIRAKSAPGAVPQAYVSQLQASEACKASSKRLCRDDEWIAACRGAEGRPFPYGREEKRGTCNDHRSTHPAHQYFKTQDPSVYSQLEHPCLDQMPDSLRETGAMPSCVTTEGAFDMVGNLHEWTADPNGTFRGGYYVETWLNGRGCDYVTTRHEAAYWDYSTGFRCCADMN